MQNSCSCRGGCSPGIIVGVLDENLKKALLENLFFLQILRNKFEVFFVLENWSCSCEFAQNLFLENATCSCSVNCVTFFSRCFLFDLFL